MRRARILALCPAVLLTHLLLASLAIAGAGSGTSGFGGGGGGGGGFSGGGGSSGGGSSCTGDDCAVSGIVIGLIVLAFIVFGVVPAIWGAMKLRAKRRERVRRVELASAEAAGDDEAFAADAVRAGAAALFVEIQSAWDARDRGRLAELVGKDLMMEWNRRLDDFERRRWHNRVEVVGAPEVEYVGLVNRAEDAEDRVTVRIVATTRDYVEGANGERVMRKGHDDETTTCREYWTLGKRPGGWRLLSIEQDAEGRHHLDADIVPTPWGDDRALREEAVAERAAAGAAPPGFSPAELADLDFDGPARAAALDLALADGRFDPDLIEASVRRALAAWAEAVDGEDAPLEAVARPEAVRGLLHPSGERSRLVVRGPRIEQVRIAALDAAAQPPTFTLEVDVRGRRYVEDRDTAAVIAGSREQETSFTERWTLALDGEGEWPWRIATTTRATAAA